MKNQSENINTFEAFLQHVMEVESGVGAAVSVIDADGVVLYEKCVGFRDREAGLPMTADTLMGIASISKSFTALAVMQLQEQGILDLEAPVRAYLPEMPWGEVKVRHLLSHTGGFYPMERQSVRAAAEKLGLPAGEDPYRSPALAEQGLRDLMKSFAAQTRFTGLPGENFSYSNDGFALLSEIVRLYGGERTFSEYVEKRILTPLGMDRSGARLVWDGENVSRLYQMQDGRMSGAFTMLDGQSPHAGAGGVKSTLNDMKKYARMYLNLGKTPDGGRVLSARGIREMLRPRAACDLGEYYGYGLRGKACGAMTIWGHGGDQPGVAAHLDWSYESGIAVIVLCNTAQVSAGAVAEMAMRLASGYSAVPSQEGLEPIEWDDNAMDAVCGEYRTGEGTQVSLQKKGRMFRVTVDGAETEAYPINRYMLRTRRPVEDMIVRVYRDDDGRVYALGGGYRMLPKVE